VSASGCASDVPAMRCMCVLLAACC
jgi:hypothetical protein